MRENQRKASVSVTENGVIDLDREVLVERCEFDRYAISLVDHFISAEGRPFLRVEFESSTLVMTLGGACTAVEAGGACFVLAPTGDHMKLTFQGDDWPLPAHWWTDRAEFNNVVLALL